MTPTRTTDANLECAFVENALLFVVKLGGPPSPLPFTTPLVHNDREYMYLKSITSSLPENEIVAWEQPPTLPSLQ